MILVKKLIKFGNVLFTTWFLMEEVNLYLCGDDTIWSTASYSEAGVDVTNRVNNKPIATKEVKLLLLSMAITSVTLIHAQTKSSQESTWLDGDGGNLGEEYCGGYKSCGLSRSHRQKNHQI